MKRLEQEFKDDPLIFLHYASGVSLFRHSKVYKLSLFYMAMLQEVSMMTGIFHYFFVKPGVELWKYLPFFFIAQGFVCLFLTQIWVYDKMADFPSFLQNNAWSYKSAGEKICIQISERCKRTIIISHLASVVVMISSMINIPVLGDETQWQYPTYLIQTFPPYLVQNYPLFTKVLFHFCFDVLTFACGASFIPLINFSMYNLSHFKIQYELLNASILRFGCGRVYHINDIRYQERIARQLKLCVKRQIQVDHIYATGEKLGNYVIIPLCIFGLITLVSSYFFIDSEISPTSNFRMYANLGAWFIVMSVFCSLGQQVTEETEKIFWNLCRCHWEHWNNQNRRTLLLLLLKTRNPTVVAGYGFLAVNYTLIRNMWRVGNALVSIFAYNLK